MAFTNDTVVKDSVAAALGQATADLESKWTTLVADANLAAYDQICHHFLLLGYSQTQIDAWDRGVTFNKFLARYQALIDGAGDRETVGEWRAELDYWRGKLEEVTAIDDGGELEEPDAGPGTVGHGTLSTSNDLFSLDADDSRRGEPTEW